MMYLVTNHEDKTWKDVLWGENVSHEEENENYQFWTYKDPLLASFMAHAYEWNLKDSYKIYEVEAEGATAETPFRTRYRKVSAIKLHETIALTKTQRIHFGILGSLYVAKNPKYVEWAYNYLKGIDTSKETAAKIDAELQEWHYTPEDTLVMEDSYLETISSVISSVLMDDNYLFSAMAVHKAYYDAISMNVEMDVEKLAFISYSVPIMDVVEMLEKN